MIVCVCVRVCVRRCLRVQRALGDGRVQDIENERHLLELRQVRVSTPNFATKCVLKLHNHKVILELPAMDDRGRVTETQANSFFEQSCPAVRSLRLALGAQVSCCTLQQRVRLHVRCQA